LTENWSQPATRTQGLVRTSATSHQTGRKTALDEGRGRARRPEGGRFASMPGRMRPPGGAVRSRIYCRAAMRREGSAPLEPGKGRGFGGQSRQQRAVGRGSSAADDVGRQRWHACASERHHDPTASGRRVELARRSKDVPPAGARTEPGRNATGALRWQMQATRPGSALGGSGDADGVGGMQGGMLDMAFVDVFTPV
jgi:hypothetical protein